MLFSCFKDSSYFFFSDSIYSSYSFLKSGSSISPNSYMTLSYLKVVSTALKKSLILTSYAFTFIGFCSFFSFSSSFSSFFFLFFFSFLTIICSTVSTSGNLSTILSSYDIPPKLNNIGPILSA